LIEINSDINAKDYYGCLWLLAGKKAKEENTKTDESEAKFRALIFFLVIGYAYIYIYTSV